MSHHAGSARPRAVASGHIAIIFYTLCCMLACGPVQGAGADRNRRFEVMHFWRSDAERAALNVIRDEFVRRYNVEWVDTILPTFDGVRKQALQRIVSGYPPDAVLWHPSQEVWNLHNMDVIHTLTGLAREQHWHKKLPDAVINTLLDGDEFVAVPSNIHNESLVWYSAAIYKRLGLDYPRSWEQLLQQAAAIHKTGHVAVAMGAPDWEKRLMYSAILNSLDPRTYLDLFNDGDPATADRPEVLRALEIMATLRDLSRTDIAQPHGAAASALVGDGRAGMQFIGDWVNEEYKNRGQVLGTDYECRIVPGDEPVHIVVVDGFILPVTGDANDETLYRQFAEVVLDPRVQIEFALEKGAIPVIKGLSDPRFDQCSRFSIEALNEEQRLTPSSAMLSISNYGAVVQSVVSQLWESTMSPRDAAELLREELVIVHHVERTP